MKNLTYAFPCKVLVSELQFSVKYPEAVVQTQPHTATSTCKSYTGQLKTPL